MFIFQNIGKNRKESKLCVNMMGNSHTTIIYHQKNNEMNTAVPVIKLFNVLLMATGIKYNNRLIINPVTILNRTAYKNKPNKLSTGVTIDSTNVVISPPLNTLMCSSRI